MAPKQSIRLSELLKKHPLQLQLLPLFVPCHQLSPLVAAATTSQVKSISSNSTSEILISKDLGNLLIP
jgi:hypothetical protein